MYEGEVQRWRLLNAAEGKFMALQLMDHDLHILAWDGLTLAEPETVGNVRLAAGNRVEVLVQAGKPGTYDLMLTPGSSQHPDIPAGLHAEAGNAAGATSTTGFSQPSAELTPRTMATVEVGGGGPRMRLPAALPAFDPPILPIAKTRAFSYTVERDPTGEFVDFGVDGVPFDPARAPYQTKLGTAEEWTLTNAADHSHVFHIHVNPFKVVKLNGRPVAKPFWRDTLVIDTPGDSATFQSNFVDFAGKTVDHCHIVSHEDLGMMEAVEIVN
jgi:FtsP/CotA-like multicopper oxidase with cupredoxin domain